MSKFKKKRNDEQPAINTASLPDIVFMLLFFFMVATVMRDNTLMVENKLPAADQIQKLDKKDQFQDTNVLTPKEKKDSKGENSSEKTNAGIIEAASVVVGSLKSKLTTTQKELERIQGLLEEERKAHEKTREELMKIKSTN